MLVRAVVLGRLILDAAPDLRRQGFLDLLLDVGDETDRAGDDRQAAAHLPREVELAEDRANGAGRVDRQLPSIGSARLLGYEPHELDIPSRQPVFEGDREQARRSWVDRLVDRVPQAGDRVLSLLLFCGPLRGTV